MDNANRLAVVLTIMVQHKTMENEESNGTEFTLWIQEQLPHMNDILVQVRRNSYKD